MGEEIENHGKLEINSEGLRNLLKRRFFVGPSFSIYGASAGLYDWGPPGCAVKTNVVNLWRSHFVLEESMLEVDCTALTPAEVLRASGHVAKFDDFLVEDEVTLECWRADHLLEDHLDAILAAGAEDEGVPLTDARRAEIETVKARVDDFSLEELQAAIIAHGVKSPKGNPLIGLRSFNLMFSTQLGPTSKAAAYLRPETAQGIFVNFKRLYEFNGSKLPFAAAQVGMAFRNEISPQKGVLRVREFQMAEIEYFVHPEHKEHAKFAEVRDVVLDLYPRAQQVGSHKLMRMSVGDAVARGIVGNESLAYFMARTHLFLKQCGARDGCLRFRQHLPNEMAHYAQDCWDAELLSSYGWIECVGHADRACYDLQRHSELNPEREQLMGYEQFAEPVEVEVLAAVPNKPALGKTYKQKGKGLIAFLEGLDSAAAAELQRAVEAGKGEVVVDGEKFSVDAAAVTFKLVKKKESGRFFYPHVIEPSFGIGRICYCLLEQSYMERGGDEARNLLAVAPSIAPVKCTVLPLMTKPELEAFIKPIVAALNNRGVSSKVDASGATIGKRYARTDEIGIPFGVTIDYDTVKHDTVTLRERDSMKQIRVPISELANLVASLTTGERDWASVVASGVYPLQQVQE
jgi:glycyl-tRNA synthetase